MQVLETEIEQKCRKTAEHHGCILLKLEKRKGWPDRQLLGPTGKLMFIEFKRPGEEPRKLQLFIHQMLRAMNYQVEVVDSYLRFLEILQAFLPPSGSRPPIRNEVESG